MEDGLREILKDCYSEMMKNITEPGILAGYIGVFTPIDKERISTEKRERGDSTGVFELLNRLQKRGPQAFPQFIKALEQHGFKELANTLEQKAASQNLLQPLWQPSAATSDERPISRGPWMSHTERSISHPVQSSSLNYKDPSDPSEMRAFKSDPVLSHINIPCPEDQQDEEVPPQQKKTKGKETLLKDIPSQLKDRIVTKLNIEAALGRNWKGIAGEIQLTAEQQGEIGSLTSPMDALFNLMAHKKYQLANLINMLKKIERHDVISEITEAGYNSSTQEEPEEEAACSSSSMNLPSPTQVSQSDISDDSKKELDEKRESHLSREVEEGKNDDQVESDQLTDMIPFEEEVFFPDSIQAIAIFVSCENYKEMTNLTQLGKQIRKLSHKLEDCAWEVTWIKDCTSAKMKNEVDLKNITRNVVCFVYLAGHTLQINGENYLLPTDIELSSATADIMDSSLNINDLVKQLSNMALMVMVIVDGAHFTEGAFECPIALTGLTSIIPPSNTVIAFPCQPGYIRPEEERLLYLKALIKVIQEENKLAPGTLFTLVKEALRGSISSPVEFSLSRSLLPILLNTSEEDEEGITIQKPTEDTPRHAFIFSDQTLELSKKTVKTGTEHLKASLNQLGWKVEMCANLEPDEIKRKIRESLKGLKGDMVNIVMLYFIGYVTKDNQSFGKESRSHQADANKISIQWLVNMMSQYVTGPKILIVDDPSLPVRHELKVSPALPQEVLLCLPKENWTSKKEKDTYTLLLSQTLAASPQSSLKNVIKTSALKWKHQYMVSKLFYA